MTIQHGALTAHMNDTHDDAQLNKRARHPTEQQAVCACRPPDWATPQPSGTGPPQMLQPAHSAAFLPHVHTLHQPAHGGGGGGARGATAHGEQHAARAADAVAAWPLERWPRVRRVGLVVVVREALLSARHALPHADARSGEDQREQNRRGHSLGRRARSDRPPPPTRERARDHKKSAQEQNLGRAQGRKAPGGQLPHPRCFVGSFF